MATERVFIPWGEYKPDSGWFAAEASQGDLLECRNVLPLYQAYVGAPAWSVNGVTWGHVPTTVYGFHAHATGAATYTYFLADESTLQEVTSGFVGTDRSRLVGGAYNPAGAGGENGVVFTSFGGAIIATNYVDDPQILLAAGAGNFAKLATSTFDPRFKFVAPFKNNLVGANCFLSGAYDTLSAGANPQLVVWSQNENARAFGSPAVNPELVGADFAPLLNDFGHITGLAAGQYCLIAQQRAWTKMEGPAGSAFSLRPIVEGSGLRFGRSLKIFDGDAYFWGPAGPSVLRGGEAPVIALGLGRCLRTLVDNTTGFSSDELIAGATPLDVFCEIDSQNRLVYWFFTSANRVQAPVGGEFERCDLAVAYNIDEDRFSLFENQTPTPSNGGIMFPVQRITPDTKWTPGRGIAGVFRWIPDTGGVEWFLSEPLYGPTDPLPPRFATGFIKLVKDRVCRVQAVRPVYGINNAGTVAPTVTINTKQQPWHGAAETLSASATTVGKNGFIGVPDSKGGDWHQVIVEFAAGSRAPNGVREFRGVELELQLGGAYSAG